MSRVQVIRAQMGIENSPTLKKTQSFPLLEKRQALRILENETKPAKQLSSEPSPTTSTEVDITTLWSSLRLEVNSITLECLLARPERLASLKSKFEELTPHWKELWDNESFRVYLFQALVWRFLADKILGDDACVLGEEFAAMKKVMKNKVSRPEDFHAWRSSTAVLLCPNRSYSTPGHVTMLVSALKKELLGCTAGPAEVLHHRLQKIVTTSMELAAAFAKSRCDYKFTFEGPIQARQLAFRRVSMEMVAAQATRCQSEHVLLVLSPSLRKFGTPSGDRYNVNTLVCKTGVVGGVKDVEEFKRRCIE